MVLFLTFQVLSLNQQLLPFASHIAHIGSLETRRELLCFLWYVCSYFLAVNYIFWFTVVKKINKKEKNPEFRTVVMFFILCTDVLCIHMYMNSFHKYA